MLIQKELEIVVEGKGLYNITDIINQAISKHRISKGICTIFIKHTSASLIIQENADPNVLKDLENYFDKIVPKTIIIYIVRKVRMICLHILNLL